ncbi:hypothetical protein SLEP1_g56567 [Rubroshorea leprosula]|uniref:Uncharacterized protein n=1 Tax=Rubroshorea leprosula TaxID=152421 RepID=A0AAV5MIW3_9ROSI|nr:hypothetical protein SLEP1_g56567 [Rubroshorea leprosula]
MADLIILNEGQLRKLATVVYYREVVAIKNIQFGSEQERVKYLRDCRSNHESIMGLLDAGVGFQDGFQDDEIKDPIAHDVFSCVKSCVNSALQMVRNYTLRMNYLKKIKEHSNFLINGYTEEAGSEELGERSGSGDGSSAVQKCYVGVYQEA